MQNWSLLTYLVSHRYNRFDTTCQFYKIPKVQCLNPQEGRYVCILSSYGTELFP